MNSGFKRYISAIIQPIGHVSTPRSYYYIPNKSSGLRYHRVYISFVSCYIGTENVQASPKSANLIIYFLGLISILLGLISQCMNHQE